MPREVGVELLVRFARLASEARTGSSVLPLVASELVQEVGAAAVAIIAIEDSGEARFVDTPELPEELRRFSVDPDTIGDDLGQRLLAACGGRFAHARSRPLVAGAGLFGMVVMFFRSAPQRGRLALAEGLVDLAAVALHSAAQFTRLAKSHADLRAAQDALVRTEKLRALGQMAAGVSHDLKNMLNPLSLHLQVVGRALDKGQIASAKESVVEMKQVLVRGVQTLERLREYSRQSPEARFEAVALNRLAHEAIEIARPRLATRGSVSRIVEAFGEPPVVQGRAGEIVSALVNLVVNAIDALPKSGTITLRTGASNGGGFVEVADDGPGMPPEVQARVFEPFFTTKGDEGTGLGLAMVYACMQRHSGSVRLETALGKGTSFTLWFPTPTSRA